MYGRRPTGTGFDTGCCMAGNKKSSPISQQLASMCNPRPLCILVHVHVFLALVSRVCVTLEATEGVCGRGVDNGDGGECKSSSADAIDNKFISTTQQWKWMPDAVHRCNITRITRTELHRRFGRTGLPSLYPYPIVILHDYSSAGEDESLPRRNAKFVEKTTYSNLPKCFEADFNVTLSSSNSLSAHRRTIPLTQYLHEITTANNGAGETYPNQLSNETWYLFGETYTDEWREMLLDYEMPPCETCPDRQLSALAFGVGNRGSGVQWHTHGPGFSEAIHGRKHWVLYPPDRKPTYNSDYASRYWMEYQYTSITEDDELPWECTLQPGDMVYFPDGWHHATINLDTYTVFVSTFTTEHV